jgi:2-hydroxychromene-2-carboxylate isomerase
MGHDLQFGNQGALEDEDLLGYARAIGLDLRRFVLELENGVHTARVRAVFLSGVRGGVNGMPTFFINGWRHGGGFDLETLLGAIVAAARIGSPD